MAEPEPRRPGWWSVRVRVTAVASLVVFVVLAGAAFAVVRAQERILVENQKEGLEQAAADLLAATDRGEAGGVLAGFGDDDAAYLVLDERGDVVAASANVGDGAALAELAPARGSVTRQVESLLGDDARFLVRAEVVEGPSGARRIVVAASLDDIEEATDALRNAFIVVVPLLTVALATLLWVVVGRSLRPVEAIRAEVEGIGGDGLDRRVPVPPGDDEVARLARTMNGMLERIEEAADRQRQFVADAAHELRTPLTRMRTELEVDLAHPSGADPAATEVSVLAEVEGLQRLVADLLDLARTDGRARIATRPVALDQLVAEVVDAARPGTTVAMETRLDPITVLGDAEALRRVVANLLDNAVRHGSERVILTLRATNGFAELAVADDGPGIPPAEAERVFERFTRLDAARTRDDGGTGLGLAIARAIAEAHGGTVAVDAEHVGGARLVARLPT